MSNPSLLWQQPDWQAEAHAWIRSALEKNNLQLTDEIKQPHIRSWSTVMTVPTNDGMLYFKASASIFAHETTEVQHWWRVGPFRTGLATFVDTGLTARRLSGGSITDVDVGIGLRGAYPGRAGALRLDIARGIRDGHIAISAVYSADTTH